MSRTVRYSHNLLCMCCGLWCAMFFGSCSDPAAISGAGKTVLSPPVPFSVSIDSITVQCNDLDEPGKFYVPTDVATPNDSAAHTRTVLDTSQPVPRLTMKSQWVARYSTGVQQRSGLTRILFLLDSLAIDGERPYEFTKGSISFIFTVPVIKPGQRNLVIMQDTVVLRNNVSGSFCSMFHYKSTAVNVLRLRLDAGGRAELISFDNKRYAARIRGDIVIRY
ncbi:MAG: hypothetical protein JNL32_00920 [Candidatus Kapabacteria bacterium]|nr:hypothetical protein [Candidatus Kapabacteria bacterium]